MKLHLGKMTSPEIAEWFGIGLKTYQNHKNEKNEILKNFCQFEEHRGFIIISEIYNDTYDNQFITNRNIKFLKSVKTHPISTVAGITRANKDFSNYSYTQARDETFGVRAKGSVSANGFMGQRKRKLVIKLSDNNEYRDLTPEEHEILQSLLDDYRPTEETLLQIAIDAKDKVITNGDFYWDVLYRFQRRTGLILTIAEEYTFVRDFTDLRNQYYFDLL